MSSDKMEITNEIKKKTVHDCFPVISVRGGKRQKGKMKGTTQNTTWTVEVETVPTTMKTRLYQLSRHDAITKLRFVGFELFHKNTDTGTFIVSDV